MNKSKVLVCLDKIISAIEKCQSFSVGVASQSVVPIGFNSSDDQSKLYNKVSTLTHLFKDANSYKEIVTYIEKNFPNESGNLGYGDLAEVAEWIYNDAKRNYKNFLTSLDSIKEMAREDAETYKAEGMNPNKLSKEELAEKCYKERVKYPSDEARKAFVDEFLANFSAEDAYVLYSYWLDKNSNKETHLGILLVSSKEACEKLKVLKTSGDTDGDIVRYKINSYPTFIRKPGAREAIKKYKTTI